MNNNVLSLDRLSPYNKALEDSAPRSLRKAIPKSLFCWLSRGTIQMQSMIKPQKWAYWTKITDEIYLGAMPLKNWDHADKIASLGIKTVLSINEDYEFKDHVLAKPVQTQDWEKKNIKVLKIASPDMEGVSIASLAQAVNYVVEQVNLGNPIYIHCNAGRGRSASVVICALTKLRGYTIAEAIEFVKKCRPQVMLNEKQIAALNSWYASAYYTETH